MYCQRVWPPKAILNIHPVYQYFAINDCKEQKELKEILFLIGAGFIETAYIKYISIRPDLISGTILFENINDDMIVEICIMIFDGQFDLDELVNT